MTPNSIQNGCVLVDRIREYPWYAIRVRSRFEKIVAAALEGKGLASFLPTYKSVRRSASGLPAQLPLFPGYVFCRMDTVRPLPVISTVGVVSIVGAGKNPIEIADAEMNRLKMIMASGKPPLPWPYLSEGQRVRISGGALHNVEGILVRVKTALRLIVSVTLLQRSVSVEIDRENVVPIAEDRKVYAQQPMTRVGPILTGSAGRIYDR